MVGFRAKALLIASIALGGALSAAAAPAGSGSAAGRPAGATLLGSIDVSASQTGRTLRPGDARVPVYVLAMTYNALLVGSETVTEIAFENRTAGPGNTAQKDTEWQSLALSWSRRAADALSPASATRAAAWTGGTVRFTGLNIPFGIGDSAYVVVWGAPSLAARDADALDLRIPSTGSILTGGGSSVNVTNGSTLDPAASFPVDGMSAAQVMLSPVLTPYFPIGAAGQLALAVRVPPNGYAADRLERLEFVNLGTAAVHSDIAALDAWIDDGDGIYEPGQEAWLGAPAFTGTSWVLGLASPIDLPLPTGAWIYLTVDVSEQAKEGATVQLALPGGSAGTQAFTVTSGNDGPNDRAIANPAQSVISLVDRVVVSPIPLPSGFARPGEARVPLFAMTATNVYTDARALTGLVLTHATSGPGTAAERDAEIQRVELRLDGNSDGVLGDFVSDPVLATAVFANGRASFSGFSVSLAPGAKRSLFVTGDVSLLHAADGDPLAATVGTREDLAFDRSTTLSGSFPLSSANAWTVDGMIAAQVGNAGAPPQTLAPNDGPREALDLLVHGNGYQDDVLQRLSVTNLGTAGTTDLAEVRLWRDGGDGAFNAGAGDDADLGAMAAGADTWDSGALAVALGPAGTRLFVSVSAGGAPADSATVRLAVPVKGIAVASGNDGPVDVPVANPDALLLANRGLLASLAFDAAAVTAGQTVTLTMTVRSTASESLLAVTPSAPALAGSARLGPLSGPSPASRALAPGASGAFAWTYSADSAGTVHAIANAAGTGASSGQPVSSLDTRSGALRVFARADSLPLQVFDAMPQSVTRGQRGVLPLYLTFVHPDPDGSPVKVTGFTVRLEREDGSDVAPASLLARAVVLAASETLLTRSTLETSGADLDLALAIPAIVAGSDPTTLVLALDVADSTVVPDFRIVIAAASRVRAEDGATGAPVTIRLQSPTWPVRSGLARVQAGATQLEVAAAPLPPVRASRGQTEVPLGTFTLWSPGVGGVTTDVRVGALDLKLADTLGARIDRPGRIVRRLRLRSGTQLLADRLVAAGADSVLALTLSPLLAVPVNTPTEMRLTAELSDTASLGPFRLELGDSARFDARDPNTGNRVPIRFASPPLHGPAVLVEERADSAWVLGVPELPAEVGLGARGVTALSVRLRHPGGARTGRLRVDSLVVRCVDASGTGLAPAPYLDRLQVLWNGALAATVSDPPATGSTLLAMLPGFTLESGDSARVTFVLDFESAAPTTTFALELGAAGLDIDDANLDLPALPVVENDGEFPLRSGVARLVAPSRLVQVDLDDAMPAVLAPDGQLRTAGVVRLTNGAAPGSGPVRISYLAVRARGAAGDVPLGGEVWRVQLTRDGVLFASGAALTSDSLTSVVSFPTELQLEPGVPVDLTLRFATRPGPALASFALALEAADIGVVQPGSPLLDVSVLPTPGRTFPLATSVGSYAAASLAGSWSSFPNPFVPEQGGTTFAYYLPAAGRVSLAIWTARGERVATLLDGEARAAGLHQSDVWNGRNGRGALVQPGVYVAELTVRLDDGRSEQLRRKVAVVR